MMAIKITNVMIEKGGENETDSRQRAFHTNAGSGKDGSWR